MAPGDKRKEEESAEEAGEAGRASLPRAAGLGLESAAGGGLLPPPPPRRGEEPPPHPTPQGQAPPAGRVEIRRECEQGVGEGRHGFFPPVQSRKVWTAQPLSSPLEALTVEFLLENGYVT